MRNPATAAPPGFTLMEVTVALAIVAVTCIPLIGMLPAGLNTMREGRREVIEAEITRLLTNELSMSNWRETGDLESFEQDDRHFDNDGVPVGDGRRSIFTARIIVGDSTILPGAAEPNRFLKKVEIRITNLPTQRSDRFTNPAAYRVHSVVIARMDK